jgi:hypothetical protein
VLGKQWCFHPTSALASRVSAHTHVRISTTKSQTALRNAVIPRLLRQHFIRSGAIVPDFCSHVKCHTAALHYDARSSQRRRSNTAPSFQPRGPAHPAGPKATGVVNEKGPEQAVTDTSRQGLHPSSIFDIENKLDARVDMSVLDQWRGKRTIVIISHNLKLVRQADDIIVIDNGRIAPRVIEDYLHLR